ncbi:signal transduction histidine kinase [Kordiimonas sediminis]|uniref:histidine kinase n=1 Tax=Kordiimonas sediminis TaxID=1735581 RepID=A0A919AWN6_9PROT|nr:PAS domain-containing sensor histidine kinase [Kordiimonas sediminis]GHF27102.1 signal transduction histidine kinase [Kordiimonas sediminis]
MDSRLPKANMALMEKEVNIAGLRLLTLALGGVLVAIGGGILSLYYVSGSAGIAWFSGALLLTAAGLFISLRQFDMPTGQAQLSDRVLIGSLMSMNRRATMISDLSGARVEANEAFTKLRPSRMRAGLVDLIPDEQSAKDLSELISEVRRKGEGEKEFPFQGDTEQSFRITGRRTGDFILWNVSINDEAGRLKREIELARDWAAPLLKQLDVGFVLEDKNGKILFANSVILKWLGKEHAEGVYPQSIRYDEETRSLMTARGQRVEAEVTQFPVMTRGTSENAGQYRLFTKPQSKPTLVPGIVTAENIMGPLADASPISTAVLTDDMKVKEFNLALGQHPAGREIAIGDSILNVIHPDDRSLVEDAIKNVQEGNVDIPPVDIRYNCQPERQGRVDFSSVLLNDVFSTVMYLTDKTQEKSLERQFVQAQKMQAVGQLAGGVAHDFNNLLTAIIGFCDLLLVRHDAGDQSFSDLIQIKQNANRAANLVRQLLAFSRQQTLRPKVLMVTDVIAELSNLLRRLIGETIELKVTHGRDLLPVKVDQGQLDQVIINLAVNARDAMPEGGKLEIRTSLVQYDSPILSKYEALDPSQYIMIEVIDTGHGIDPDNLAKIFEPFFTTKEVGQGTGLGLSTVYGIVKQTGGYVFVESKVGQGTTFMILLKAHEAQDVIEASTDHQEISVPMDLSGKGAILLVEDEDPVRMFAARALTNKGYTVHEAASGEKGLEILQSDDTKVDLLISDVVMPNMDGPTLVTEARKLNPNLPVIFISGYAEDLLRDNLEAEEFHFLPKPFSLKDLAETVKNILEERS